MLIFDWIFGATEQKKLLNELAISLGAVRKVSSFIILGISESLHFKEKTDFMHLKVFLMFIRLVLK